MKTRGCNSGDEIVQPKYDESSEDRRLPPVNRPLTSVNNKDVGRKTKDVQSTQAQVQINTILEFTVLRVREHVERQPHERAKHRAC
ncbi:hypothetical protein NDU88_001372 [Pleurodeles waltl]|uniref:Uncharacterized protein n=1 Tax=Pleurodeles waltl TaxID=8319 RepID=A0AAV7T027_PLEWA|nr:hypothetical protein NDU88_001372 [Pleurodeles waltl]